MDKKTGNLFLFLCFYTFTMLGQDRQVKLNIYDMQKNRADQVEAGVPFFLDIVCSQFDRAQEPKEIPEFENFAITPYNTQQSFVSVNGKQDNKTIFSYIVTPEKKGTFDIGPITIKDKHGEKITSQRLTVIVGDSTITPVDNRQQPYLLQTIINSKSAYIGQKIKVIIQFLHKDEFSNLSFMDSMIAHFHRGFVSPATEQGSTKINDVEYKYQQVVIELFPEKTGLLVIPMFQAAFIPAMRYQLGFGLQMQRAVQSSPRSIDVKALPASKQYKDVSAIGSFDNFSFSIQQTKGNVGEGIVATMIVQGDGNLEVVKAPHLNLPDGLHHYEGNSSVERINNDISSKKFEWIIQADKAGNFSIDAQKFVYFEPVSQSYKTLTSTQSFLKITGNGSVKTNTTQTDQPTSSSPNKLKQKDGYSFKQDEINTINNSFDSLKSKSKSASIINKMMTWFIYLLLYLSIFIVATSTLFSLFGKSIRKAFWINYIYYRYLFYVCQKQQNTQKLHQLFIKLEREQILDLNGQQLSDCFAQLKLPGDSFQLWQEFFNLVLSINFAGKKSSEKEREEIFMQAQYWFSALLSCCKLQKRSYPDKSVIS